MIDHNLPVIVLASSNKGKLAELQQLVGDAATVRTASDLGVTLPAETGETFEENAVLKSQAAFEQTGFIAIADDSGLEVDALNGAPGVYSARYAGPDADDEANNRKLLSEIADVADHERTARFRSAIAITVDAETTRTFAGSVEGTIGTEPKGSGGFGYDPLFVLPDCRTMAEYAPEEKNSISHRGAAMREALPWLLGVLQSREGGS